MRHILAQATIQDLMSERDHILERVQPPHSQVNDPRARATRRAQQNRLIALYAELDRRGITVQ